MRISLWRVASPAFLTWLFLPQYAMAQQINWFSMGTWSGSLTGTYGVSSDRSIADGKGLSFSAQTSSFAVNIMNNSWSILETGIVSGSIGLSLGLDHTNSSVTTTPPITTKGKSVVLGYSFSANILDSRPYGGRIFANKTRSTTIQPFGHQENRSSTRGLTLRLSSGSPLKDLGLPYLDAYLSADQDDVQTSSSNVFSSYYKYREKRDNISLRAHKGSVNSDLYVNLSHHNVKQPYSTLNGYKSNTASLDYSGDLGPRMNRHLSSDIIYFDRTGVRTFRDFSINEHLHIVHYNNLSTTYLYHLTRNVNNGTPMKSQIGKFGIGYTPYQNLGFGGSLEQQTLPNGRIRSASAGFAYHLLHPLQRGGMLTLRLNQGYGITGQRINNTTVTVPREVHTAPSSFGAGAGFSLNQNFVIPESIVVLDTQRGVIQATQGSDYTIEQLGNQTYIEPTLGSVVIQPGDSLEVSYNYQISPSVVYDTISNSLELGLNFKWVSLGLSHSDAHLKVISGGTKNLLLSSNRNSARIVFTKKWRKLKGTAEARFMRSEQTLTSQTETNYQASLKYLYRPNLEFACVASETQSVYSRELVRRLNVHHISFKADWRPMENMRVLGTIGQRSEQATGAPSDTIDEAKVRSTVSYGKFRFSGDLLAEKRIRGDSSLDEWSIDLSMMRYFP